MNRRFTFTHPRRAGKSWFKLQTIDEMDWNWNVIGFSSTKKKGKYTKRAVMLIIYGAGFDKALKESGLNKRCLKKICKKINNGYPMRSINPPKPKPQITAVYHDEYRYIHLDKVKHVGIVTDPIS